MAGQVMEAQAQLQRPMTLAQLPPSCKNDLLTTTTTMPATSGSITTAAAATAADLAYLQHLQNAAAEAKNNNNGNGGSGGARGEQCPRCASHDTKFCYYNNYNTSQPRHFCRSCRRYWTLGGSLRNVPIGGSTRKRPRLAHPPPPARRPPAHVFGLGCGVPPMPPPPSQGLLGSLFALSAAPLLEGRGAGFDLGLGLPAAGHFGAGGDVGLQMQDLGLRGDGGGPAGTSPLFWSTGLLDNDSVDTWKVPGTGAGAMWPESSAASPAQAGGLLHGGAQLM